MRQRSRRNLISRNTEPQTAESAYQCALRLLAVRDYSVAKLQGKLLGRGVCDQDAEAVLARLQQEGWLNDRRYAERFAESALSSGRFYGLRLRMEMRRRGFGAGLADEVLGALEGHFDEAAEVRDIVCHRYPGFVFSSAPERDKRRIIGYLQRRGFGLSAIMKVLKALEED